MVTVATCKKMALSFPGSFEMPHFEKMSFRTESRIFATLDAKDRKACLRLTATDQSVYCAIDPLIIYPVNNKWGKQGWTFVELKLVKRTVLKEALAKAWSLAAPKKHLKIKATNKTCTMKKAAGTKEDPWVLKTPPGSSEFTIYKDDSKTPPILVCTVGKTVLHYQYSSLADLHQALKKHGGWMELGSADEQKPAKEGTVEAWGRDPNNPNGGWYGLKKGFRGRFGMYIPPLMELLGLAEVEHQPKNNRMRAL